MNITLFLSTLPYMLKGTVGIFAVTSVIILAIVIMNLLTSRAVSKKDISDENKD